MSVEYGRLKFVVAGRASTNWMEAEASISLREQQHGGLLGERCLMGAERASFQFSFCLIHSVFRLSEVVEPLVRGPCHGVTVKPLYRRFRL